MFSAAFVCLSVCVCVCVCQFVRTVTSERLNTGRSNLAVRYIVQKILAPVRRSRSKVKVTRNKKKRKTAESSPLTMHSMECAVAKPYTQHATRSNRRYHCVPSGGDGLRRWEKSTRCLVIIYFRPVVSSFFFLSFFFSSRLISAVLDWMSTILPQMVWP